jgi:hypothetical protein
MTSERISERTSERRLLVVAFTMTAALLAAGCGSSASKGATGNTDSTTAAASSGNKTAFCRDNATLNTKSQAATSVAEVITIFKNNVAVIDDFGKQAPANISADAHTIVVAAHKVISSGSITAFGATAIGTAGKRVDTYCGVSSGSTTTP